MVWDPLYPNWFLSKSCPFNISHFLSPICLHSSPWIWSHISDKPSISPGCLENESWKRTMTSLLRKLHVFTNSVFNKLNICSLKRIGTGYSIASQHMTTTYACLSTRITPYMNHYIADRLFHKINELVLVPIKFGAQGYWHRNCALQANQNISSSHAH